MWMGCDGHVRLYVETSAACVCEDIQVLVSSTISHQLANGAFSSLLVRVLVLNGVSGLFLTRGCLALDDVKAAE